MRPYKFGRHFTASVARAKILDGSEKAVALDATIAAIREAKELPMYCDAKVTIAPVRTGFVRRVRNLNIWLHFELKAETVVFTLVVTHPPVPVDET